MERDLLPCTAGSGRHVQCRKNLWKTEKPTRRRRFASSCYPGCVKAAVTEADRKAPRRTCGTREPVETKTTRRRQLASSDISQMTIRLYGLLRTIGFVLPCWQCPVDISSVAQVAHEYFPHERIRGLD